MPNQKCFQQISEIASLPAWEKIDFGPLGQKRTIAKKWILASPGKLGKFAPKEEKWAKHGVLPRCRPHNTLNPEPVGPNASVESIARPASEFTATPDYT